jgi:outer membrane translocation and assembly module TamA
MAQFQMSDLLGDHHVRAAIDVHGSLRDANALLGYYYLARRVDLGIGVFHFRDLPGTLRPVFGEIPGDDRVFSERDVGVFGVASLPFTPFTRLDLELGLTDAKREFFRANLAAEDYDLVATERRALAQPAFTLVHDTSEWGRSTRPRAGSRYSLSIAPALPIGEHAVQRTSLLLDYRRYAPFGRRNTLAGRLLGGLSTGRDPLTFYLGGPTTLRGFDYLDFAGTRLVLASLEYRVPLVDAIVLGWPGRWTLGDVGGVAFVDLGSAWYASDDSRWRFLESGGGLRLHDARADFGLGLRLPLAYFHARLDFAWPTDLRTTQGVRTNFSLGFDY